MNKVLQELVNDLPKNEAWWNEDDKRDECSKYLVNSTDYLQKCCDKADWVCPKALTFDEVWDFLEGIAKPDDIEADNTYNYSGNIDRELDFKFVDDGHFWIAFRIHRGGDVRGNYTDAILMRFDSRESWYEVEYDMQNQFDIEVDGKNYTIEPLIFSEYHNCWDENCSTELYLNDITDEECRKEIRKWVEPVKA